MGEIKKIGTVRKGKIVDLDTKTEMLDITPVDIFLSGPSGNEPTKISKEDVWGKWDDDCNIKISDGMIVANYGNKCPIFKDIVPYKSVTVVCNKEDVNDVTFWLEYVHGANAISKEKSLPDGKIALRSDYQCW